MTENKYILSICIPTRNRADVLVHTLDSIVNNPFFSNEIEVVVSDNASTDGTQQLVKKYTKRFANVRYYRENENVGVHKNIVKVLDVASGCFLKLNNDYSVFTSDGLEKIIYVVKKYIDKHNLLLFDNTIGRKGVDFIEDMDINQLIQYEGWGLSFMGEYGFWREDWQCIENKLERAATMFILDGHFLRMMTKKKTANVCILHYMDRYLFQQKQGGYNFFKVHTLEYLSLFEEYYRLNQISKETYDVLHYKLFTSLLPFLTKFLITEKENYSYDLNGWFGYFFRAFGQYIWFYPKMIRWELSSSLRKIKKIYHHVKILSRH